MVTPATEPAGRAMCPCDAGAMGEVENHADRWVCPRCALSSDERGICPACDTRLRRNGRVKSIQGDADDVIRVHRELSAIATADREQRKTPWRSGSFYLVALIATVLVLLVVGRALPLWALPIVAITAVLGVVTVGAIQLRHDQRLSERNFVKLMLKVLARLPSLLRSTKSSADDRSAE